MLEARNWTWRWKTWWGPWLLFLGVVGVLALVVQLIPKPPPPSPEELERRSRQERLEVLALGREEATKRVREERDSYLCALKKTCANYATVRQSCATAGDFANCISVKMGQEANRVSMCRNDGNLLISPPDLPTDISCRINDALSMFGLPRLIGR